MAKEPTERPSNGKVGSLPPDLRERICREIFEEVPYAKILAWVNVHPDALRVFDSDFHEEPLLVQNLSSWKKGGYRKWLREQDRIKETRRAAEWAGEIAAAAGNGKLSEGMQAILAGRILEKLEHGTDPEELVDLAKAVATLRGKDIAAAQLDLSKRSAEFRAKLETKKLDHNERKLGLSQAKFERQTVEQFMKWANSPEAQAILNSSKPKATRLRELAALMFPKIDHAPIQGVGA